MFSLDTFISVFLAAFFSIVAGFYLCSIALRKRQFKQSALVDMGTRYSLHWWNHLTFRIFRISIWGICVLRLFYPTIDDVLLLFTTFPKVLNLFGLLLLTGGFTLTIIAHQQMNGSWRSGLDRQKLTPLITHGVYARSRNPAFIGVMAGQLGFFLALPSMFTLLCLCIGSIAILIQTHLEERHLLLQHENIYRDYQNHVPRWF
ncbi:methyltransferase family protein [Alteromonas flava]|uniref:methyltransferase family protein n=1 Tax=Alteromonas flava TaxID=2048003 RepID=UPI000C28624B|nr:methyltransferase [Alteromonas flava]